MVRLRRLAAATPPLIDLLVVAVSYLLATGVRLGGRLDSPEHTGAAAIALAAGAVQVGANLGFRIYRRDWAVAALADVVALSGSSAVVATGLLLLNVVSPDHFIPTAAVLPGLGLAIVGQAALKLRPRWQQIARATFGRHDGGDGAIVIGSGRVAQLLERDLATGERRARVLCFVDDDPRRHGTYVRGIPISGGVDDLPALVARHRPAVVVIADGRRNAAVVRRVLDLCAPLGVRVRAVDDLGLDRDDRSPLRPITVEELLQRDRVDLDTPDARAYVSGKVILVTGGAGSIGRELARRLLELGPARVVLLDTSETGLSEALAGLGSSRIEGKLGDVRDRASLIRLIGRLRPDVVFHTAAYKHVPIVETQPREGIVTNVVGTANVLDAARQADVPGVVFISSDKAVRPIGVLGLTKRFGELLTLAHAMDARRAYGVVRFGNVLASSGSVVLRFTEQIQSGGPVTVTHEETTRYFMSPDEAAGLVIHAAALASRGGDLLVLDMGAPVRIVDLAHTMIRLRGLRVPEDIAIEITGLRPGEKLHEELFFPAERSVPTDRARVLRVADVGHGVPSLATLRDAVAAVDRHCAHDDPEAAIAVLRHAIDVDVDVLAAV